VRDVLAFAGVAAVIVVVPGPGMALVLRNGIAHGRRAALETALGINAGLLVWALAARARDRGVKGVKTKFAYAAPL
jgi:threonine/homoserine/homoserine lactone efflux protein